MLGAATLAALSAPSPPPSSPASAPAARHSTPILLRFAAASRFPPSVRAFAGRGATCVTAANATYRHTFDGAAGIATITAKLPLCRNQSQPFSLVSYTAPAASQPGGLFVYATAHATINSAHRSATLRVAVPPCSTQVYAYFGSQVINETTTSAPLYGSSRLGATGSRSVGKFGWYTGGTAACTANPIATFISACDNTFSAALSNSPNANTDAVFIRSDSVIRVAPGRSLTISAPKGATLTLRASNFNTYVGTWRQPSTPCSLPHKPQRTTAAPPAPVPPAAGAAAPARTASSAPSAFATPVEDVANPPALQFATSPTPAAAATTPASGMSPGSMVAIGLGFLLMGCGAVLLRRVIRSLRDPA